ncbi:MAG TPA: M23 family metallopeptidase [Myxococcota bacterium]|nr:M23 family metallopeptidase [Myxococcales bacterium]HPG27376.1 M23 family metallopeptidase [Myxococcota bacterium]
MRDATAALPMRCEGRFAQGGMAVCLAEPDARITIGEAETRADETGEFVLGFDRDAPAEESIRLVVPDGRVFTGRLPITPRRFDVSRIDGLPPSQVDQFTKEQLARIEASTARKERGDRSRAALHAFRDRFARPLAARRTSPFGAQRILNGVPARPHYGVDLAAPVGTPIVAPADGVVALADSDLYFEGAMIVLDHGQGFLSKYLHVSRIDVEAGSRVRRGQTIGAVGSRGRSTGPHLCWRLKWRDRNLDPELWLADGAGAVAEKEPR